MNPDRQRVRSGRLAAVLLAGLMGTAVSCRSGSGVPVTDAGQKQNAEVVSAAVSFGALPEETRKALVRGAGGEALADLFRDMTAQAGIDFTYHNGQEAGHYAILESLGG